MRLYSQRRRGESGASAVEFALVLVPFLILVFGVIQFGYYFFSMQTGTYAVQQGVRRISVGDCTSNAALKTYLKNRLGASTTSTASALSPTVTYTKASDGTTYSDPTTGNVGDSVKLTLSFPTLNFHFPLIPTPNGGTVTRSSTGVLENTTVSNQCPTT